MNEQSVQGQRQTFIVFSDDWGEHMSSSQHLFRRIALEHTVVWVNTIGMRAPVMSAKDLLKAWHKVSKMCIPNTRTVRTASTEPRVAVCQPLMLPYSGVGPIRRFNAHSVIRNVYSRVRSLEGSSAVTIVATVPNAGDYCDKLPGARVVYYCVDDFTQWPGFDVELVRDMERRLIERSDVIIAASNNLRDRLITWGKPVHLLTHGVDIEHFSKTSLAEHRCLVGIRKPRVGFFGLIDDRVDQELLCSMANRMPEVSFVLAGPTQVSVRQLARCNNIRLPGPLPYGELPAFVSGMDALFIPYRSGNLGDSLSPLKLKEYLVTGKPVVSAPIGDGYAHSDCVTVAHTLDDWSCAIKTAFAGDPSARRGRIISAMQSESWSNKARTLVELCRGQSPSRAFTTAVDAA